MSSSDAANQKMLLARLACEAVGLDPQRDAGDVIAIADEDPEYWEACCDGGCEPCVAVLQSAALALRRKLAAPST